MKIKNKFKISLLISIFIITLINIKAFATTGVITEVTVNMREKASKDSKRIMYVTQDDKVEVLEKDGDWYKIKFKNKTGYVISTYVDVDQSSIKENKNEDEDNDKSQVKEEHAQQEITQNVELKLYIKEKTDIKIIPNILSSVIYTVSEEKKVNIIEQLSGWTYIKVEDTYGWVRTDKIIEQNAEEKEENISIGYIKYDTVNMRKEASATAKVVAKLKINDEVNIIEKKDEVWTKVEVDGKTGYISTELIADKKQEVKEIKEDTTSRNGDITERKETIEDKKKNEQEFTVETIQENKDTKKEELKTKGEEIVEYAKKYLGYKYVYGGSSPSKGFDCSGFTSYIYKHFGYTLSRSSVAQANNGKKVEKDELQLGDILIFKNTSLTKIGHVGIYIGNNQMIHASEPKVGVTITDIDSKSHKYPQRYVMARRII